MQLEFVNRHKEVGILEKRRDLLDTKNSIIILKGVSGVGKSALTQKFLSESDSEAIPIKVRISTSEQNAYSTGYYLNRIGSSFNEKAKKDARLMTFWQFLELNKGSKEIVKMLGIDLKDDLIEQIPGKKVINSVWKLLTSRYNLNENEFFTSTHSEKQLVIAEYIKHELNRVPLILNIENIQGTDQFSFNQICGALSKQSRCLLLLEFTEEQKGYSLREVIKELEENNLVPEILSVRPLDIEEVKKIIQSNPKLTWDLFKESYVNWKGNLRPLVDILAQIKYGIDDDLLLMQDLKTGSREHLKALDSSELFVLNVILWHVEPVELGLLKRLMIYPTAIPYVLDVEGTLERLDKRFFLEYSNDGYSIRHDSLQTELKQLVQYELHSLISQKFWLNVYDELLEQTDLYISKGFILKKVLFYASMLQDTERIYELLDLISFEVLRSREPEKMISYVEQVQKLLLKQNNNILTPRIEKINLWLVEVNYTLGKAKHAWQYLECGIASLELNKVLKAILLEQIGKHSEAIKFCIKEIPNSTSKSQELALRLVLLVTQYDIGMRSEVKEAFNYLYEHPDFSQCIEYGFLLRNAELVFTFRESLPYYKKSVDFFTSKGAFRQASYSRITYGVHLGLTGQFQNAREQFDKAKDELGEMITERHSLFNNLAVVNIYENKLNEETMFYLRQAMVSADGDFEKVAINMNYLALMDWMGEDAEAIKTIKTLDRIIETRSFASTSILLGTYYNIFRFYERIEDSTNAELYLKKMEQVGIPYDSPLWRKRLNNEEMPIDYERYYYGVLDRSITFLCNWNMEFDSKLMRY